MEHLSNPQQLPRFGRGLSARFLVLTILFVLLTQLLFFAPSITRYRMNWLEQKLGEGHLAILAQRSTRGFMLDPELEIQLLNIADLKIVALRTIDGRNLIMRGASPAPLIDKMYDLGQSNFFMDLRDVIDSLINGQSRVIRVIGPSPRARYASVEVVLNEGPMRQALISFGGQWLRTSLYITVATAMLLYGLLQWLAIAPMRRLTQRMVRFRNNPEEEDSIDAPPSKRGDELGVAERELAEMQVKLRQALQQKTRLAALGTAVTKINHDLRGILATARLIADRLVNSDDPQVRKAAPRLVVALDRAVDMCSDTLNFAKEAPIQPILTKILLPELHEELREDLSEYLNGEKEWLADFGGVQEFIADKDQLHRVLYNLSENAFQMGARQVALVVRSVGQKVQIDIRDDGPGLPPKALDHLFIPFKGSARAGGTGLGLAIARESMKAMGGDLRLLSTGATGTIFRMELPMRQSSADILPFKTA